MTEAPPKRRRVRSDQEIVGEKNVQGSRCAAVSQTKEYFLGTRAVEESRDKIVERHDRSKKAAAASWNHSETDKENSIIELTSKDLEKGMAKKRSLGIEYFFVHILDCPDEETWDVKDIGALSFIMNRMNIPSGSRQSVRKILIDIVNARNGIATEHSWGGSTPMIQIDEIQQVAESLSSSL